MAFVRKYKSGGGTRDLEKESREYAYETPKEPEQTNIQPVATTTTPVAATTTPSVTTDNKLTINDTIVSKAYKASIAE